MKSVISRCTLRRRYLGLLLIPLAALTLGTSAVTPRTVNPILATSNGGAIASWAWGQVGHGYTGCHYRQCGNLWCAAFASTGWDAGGGMMPWTASVSSIQSWAVANHRWSAGAGAYHHPGDLVVFGSAHVGIIVSGTGYGGSIKAIDGNWGGAVGVVGPYSVYNPGGWEPGLHVSGYVTTVR